MKKKFKLNELGCANCAAKMEEAISKINGVESAKINFMAEKLIIELDESRADEIMAEAAKIVSSIEPDCSIVM